MSDKICSSADKVLEVFLENAPMDTSHHRMVKQQNKCGYGLQEYVVDYVRMVHVVYHRRNQRCMWSRCRYNCLQEFLRQVAAGS